MSVAAPRVRGEGPELPEAPERAAEAANVPAPAVARAVAILDFLADNGEPATLTEIASALGLAKSSASNLLTTLEVSAMVQRGKRGWELGTKLLELSRSILRGTNVMTEFRRLTARPGLLYPETVLLGTMDGDEVLYLARHDGSHSVRLASDIGRRLPAVVTALGKAMLSRLHPAELQEVLRRATPLPRLTPRSHRTTDELLRDLAAIRERGYSVDDEQNSMGITCVGVPVRGSRPLAVSVTMPTRRATPEFRARVAAELKHLASALEASAQ